MLNDSELIESFSRCKELGILPSVHAENGDLVWWKQRQLIGQGITGPIGHPLSRPASVTIYDSPHSNKYARRRLKLQEERVLLLAKWGSPLL